MVQYGKYIHISCYLGLVIILPGKSLGPKYFTRDTHRVHSILLSNLVSTMDIHIFINFCSYCMDVEQHNSNKKSGVKC